MQLTHSTTPAPPARTRIALLAEGCYPYVTGGVSTWCDQLVRGLTSCDFQVVAITGAAAGEPVLALPDNVRTVTPVALWGDAPPRRTSRRRRRAGRQRLLDAYADLLRAMLDLDAPAESFTAALRRLALLADADDLTDALQSEQAMHLLLEVWADLGLLPELSLRDALDATDLVEHFLRPLSAPVVEADVCHAVSNGLPALLALKARWIRGTPMVMSEHGVYLRERYLAFSEVQYRWPVKLVLLRLFRRLCWTAYAAADVIVPVNVYNQRWEVRHGADPDSIATAYNGVSADAYPVATSDPEVPTIGWVGRIDPLKDLPTLVRAFALVRQSVPAAVLRLFGPTPVGNEWYEAELRSLVDELDLGDSVRFEGPVRPVTSAYHSSTLVALSSISEGLPYTVMEAMMCRRATVSTDVGGVSEVTGEAGLVVPPRDPESFAAACVRVLEDPALRERLAAAARVRALQLFQLDRMLTVYTCLYDELIATPAELVPAAVA
jgi:glycosyltransferase involved in cell wall biosynthesis